MSNNETSIIISAVDKTEGALKSIQGNLGQVGGEVTRLQGIVGGFAAVAGVGMFASMIKGSVESMAGLQQLSEQTGATVEGLSAMRTAAQLSGTDMTAVGGALQKLAKNMVSLDDEGKDASKAIAAIGLSAAELKNMKPDEAMKAIADAMAGYSDGAEKTAIAMALFGKAGANALPFLKDLAEVQELNAKVTAEQAEQADKFEKNLSALAITGKAWQQEIAAGMLPALASFSEAALVTINGVGGLREEFKKLSDDGTINDWATGVINGMTYIADAVEGAARVFTILGKTIGAAAAQLVALAHGDFSGALNIGKAWKEDIDQVLNKPLLGQRLREAFAATASAKQQALADYGKAAADVIAAYAGYDIKIQQAAQKSLRDSYFGKEDKKSLAGYGTGGHDAAAAEKDKLPALLDKINGKESGLDASYWKDLETLNKAYQTGKLNVDDYAEAIGKLTLQQKFAKDLAEKEATAEKAVGLEWARQADTFWELNKARAEAEQWHLGTVAALNLETETLGMTSEARERYIAGQKLAQQRTEGLIKTDDEYLDRLNEINAAYDRRDRKKQVVDEAKQAEEAWKRTTQEIERSLTDSLMRGFESGKGFAENFRDTLVNMFKTLVLRPIIQGVVQGGMSAVGLGSAQGGGGLGSIGSIASAGNSAYSLFSGGSSIAGYWQAGQAGAGLSASEAANAAAAYYNAGYYGTGASIEAGYALGGGAAAGTYGAGLSATAGDVGLMYGGTAAGGAAAEGGLMSTLGSIPVYGWIAAAVIAAYMIFSKDGGGPKTGGDSYLSFTGDTASAMSSSQLATLMPNLGGNSPGVGYFTPDNGNAMASQIIAPVGASIAATIKSLGGTADGLKLGLGYDTDPQGDASSRVQSGVYRADGSKVYDVMRDVGRDADMAKEMTVELQRMTLGAISAADGIPKIFTDIVSGIDLTTATAEQMTQALNDVQSAVALRDAFEDLNLDMDGLTVSLINGAGGIAALATSLESYYQGYFSTQEQNDRLTASLTQSFTDLGLTMPTTRAGFRALVEGLDLTTVAGQNTFNALMGLQGSFGTIADAASAAATAASTAASTAAAEAQKQAAANATAANDAYFNAVQSAQDIAKSFNGILDSLRDYQQSLLLGDSSSLSSEARYAEAKNKYETTLSKAQHGDATAAGSLQAVADEFLAASQASSATATAYALDFGGVIAALEDLIKHKAVSNVDSIMRSTPGYVEAGMPLLTKHVSAFAAGGYHAGGLRLVGENGPELEVTGPSRIFNAGDTRNMLGGEALLEELRALRQEVAQLRADQRAGQAQIASNTGKTAKLLDRVMPDGDAIQTRIAA